jgi:hypothetical protein
MAGDECGHGELHKGWQETVSDWTTITWFALNSWTYDKVNYHVDMLLLQPKPGGHEEYVRIGLVDGLSKAWFDERASPATITIT